MKGVSCPHVHILRKSGTSIGQAIPNLLQEPTDHQQVFNGSAKHGRRVGMLSVSQHEGSNVRVDARRAMQEAKTRECVTNGHNCRRKNRGLN